MGKAGEVTSANEKNYGTTISHKSPVQLMEHSFDRGNEEESINNKAAAAKGRASNTGSPEKGAFSRKKQALAF